MTLSNTQEYYKIEEFQLPSYFYHNEREKLFQAFPKNIKAKWTYIVLSVVSIRFAGSILRAVNCQTTLNTTRMGYNIKTWPYGKFHFCGMATISIQDTS